MNDVDRRAEILWRHISLNFKKWDCIGFIKKALIEQDKATRHACAEAVLRMDTKYTTEGDDDYVDVNAAHEIIMNCRGGVE